MISRSFVGAIWVLPSFDSITPRLNQHGTGNQSVLEAKFVCGC